ncbi:MAG: ArnT family glycosyltransferase, partial [Actinomycetota bacterium]
TFPGAAPHAGGEEGASFPAGLAEPRSSLPRRLVRGRPEDPAWVRPALLALLVGTGVLYLWGLGQSGWANSFYSAAVQAGTKSWKAFFFGSSDAANFITVDKPPAALWVMELSARIFGLHPWSVLAPEALEGVASVAVLYAAVKRWAGPAAGLVAGAVLALTPVAALMFRFNNPDALLVLLLVIGAYATVRAIEGGSGAWLALAGVAVGFGFLAKMLQTLLVVPGFAAAYLLAGQTTLGRRLVRLAGAGAAMVVSALWWVVAVMVVPAADRPYIGGSQNNSLWNLIFGYNGFGRLTGNENGSVGGGGTAGSRWGPTGLLRMFNSDFGAQASWLIPAALILAGACLLLVGRSRRTDRIRAAIVLWGGWLLMTAGAFSLGKGIIHPYYTVALAPAVGALIGIGGAFAWRERGRPLARVAMGLALAASSVWAYVLLSRTPAWHPELRDVVLLVGLILSVLLMGWTHLVGRAAPALVTAAVIVALLGPGAYSLATAATAHRGAIPSAGPSGTSFGPGGGPAGGPAGAGAGQFTGGALGGGGAGGGGGGGGPSGGGAGGGGASPGGILGASTPSAALTEAVEADASRYTWVAATVSSNQAAGYQLATGDPVMAIGGFNGTDPAPTLAEFEDLVAKGEIHYFIGTGGGLGTGGGAGGPDGAGGSSGGTASQITSWVESRFTATTVGGTTLFGLTSSR